MAEGHVQPENVPSVRLTFWKCPTMAGVAGLWDCNFIIEGIEHNL